ncbi:MAG: RNA polymerase sigma factor [Sulfobacillus sp.]
MRCSPRLVERAKQGDDQAFSALIEPLWPALYRLCYRFVLDRGQAQDLAQDALTRAWLRLPQLRQDEQFASWLLAIATNLAKNQLCRHREVPVADLLADCPAVGTELDRGLLNQEYVIRLGAALATLPPMQRVAVQLVLQDGLPYRQAAAILDHPVGTVKTWVHRGRHRLKAQLTADLPKAEGGVVDAFADL